MSRATESSLVYTNNTIATLAHQDSSECRKRISNLFRSLVALIKYQVIVCHPEGKQQMDLNKINCENWSLSRFTLKFGISSSSRLHYMEWIQNFLLDFSNTARKFGNEVSKDQIKSVVEQKDEIEKRDESIKRPYFGIIELSLSKHKECKELFSNPTLLKKHPNCDPGRKNQACSFGESAINFSIAFGNRGQPGLSWKERNQSF